MLLRQDREEFEPFRIKLMGMRYNIITNQI